MEKGKRMENRGLTDDVLGQTETERVASGVGGVPVPVRSTQILRKVVPGAATKHALTAATLTSF